jgi:hypothetical protein
VNIKTKIDYGSMEIRVLIIQLMWYSVYNVIMRPNAFCFNLFEFFLSVFTLYTTVRGLTDRSSITFDVLMPFF